MSHNSSVFEINNSTRYNTDDIVAIFRAVEDELTKRGVVPKESYNMSTCIDVVDYNPASPHRDANRWDDTTRSYRVIKVYQYVKDPGYTLAARRTIGIMQPDKLYDNPLEALTHSEDTLAPELLALQLVNRVMQTYAFEGMDYSHREPAEKAVLEMVKEGVFPIRIEEKRGAAKKSDIRIRKERDIMLSAARSVQYETRKIISDLALVKGRLALIAERGLVAKVDPLVSPETDLVAALQAVEDLNNRLQRLEASLL